MTVIRCSTKNFEDRTLELLQMVLTTPTNTKCERSRRQHILGSDVVIDLIYGANGPSQQA